MTSRILALSRARRTAAAPWAVIILLVALVAGCTAPAPARPPQLEQADSFQDQFRSANGLWIVPELWGALDRSTTARLLRHLAQRAAGRSSAWPLTAAKTYRAVASETDPVRAARLVRDAGLPTDGLWDEGDVRRWWTAAVTQGDIDREAMIVAVSSNPSRLSVDAALLDAWRALSEGADTVPAQEAFDLLARYAPDPQRREPGSQALNFRNPGDAATYLLRAAEQHAASPNTADPRILRLARDAVPTDDQAMYALARAYADAGDQVAAAGVVDLMDPRRLLPDGAVLEVPVFEGSVGSSYRLVRTLVAAHRLDQIKPELQSALVQQARGQLNQDVSHRVTGLALIQLLAPGTVEPREAQAAVGEALRAAGGDRKLDTMSAAIGWTSVSEYADTLGIPVRFPGVSTHVIHTWVVARAPQVTVSMSRFLLGVARAHQRLARTQVDSLVGRITRDLRDPAARTSLELFSGALAVHATTGAWVMPPLVLRQQAAARNGGCLGGFDGFVRDRVAPDVECNADASWLLTNLLAQLDH